MGWLLWNFMRAIAPRTISRGCSDDLRRRVRGGGHGGRGGDLPLDRDGELGEVLIANDAGGPERERERESRCRFGTELKRSASDAITGCLLSAAFAAGNSAALAPGRSPVSNTSRQ